MPTYCYRDSKGEVIEASFPMGRQPREIRLPDGSEATRDFAAERVGVPSTKGWPIECVASGVNAEQSGELREHLARAGVRTEVTHDGNPLYRDANHRRKALKARGLVDKSSYI